MIHIKKLMCASTVICIVLTQTYSVEGAFEYQGLGWPAATANIRVIGSSVHQSAFNPALFVDDLTPAVSISYQYPLQGLDLEAGDLVLQNRLLTKKLIHSLAYLGDMIYSEIMFGTGTGWQLENGFQLGLKLTYQRLTIAEYEPKHSMAFSLGSSTQFNDQFKIASLISNLIQVGNDLRLPQQFHLGGAYEVGQLTLLSSLEKVAALPIEANLGLIFRPSNFWEIGLGYRGLTGSMSAGWRIKLDRIVCYYVVVTHPHLPMSQGFGLELILP